MKTIDKNNYEAYYLDFLEGRLNAQNTILLMTFLDQFPELRIDNELVTLEQKSIFLDESYKKSLKQVLFEEELVTKSTINSFLIDVSNEFDSFKFNFISFLKKIIFLNNLLKKS